MCERMDNSTSYSTTNNATRAAKGTSRRRQGYLCIGCIKGLPWDTVKGHAVRQLRYLVNYLTYATGLLITIGCHVDVRIEQSDTYVPPNPDVRYFNST